MESELPTPYWNDPKMKIEILIKTSDLKQLTPRSYDPEEDDVRSILIDICHSIEGQVDFKVSGFGQDRWPVDTSTDLAVFLEQLPNAIRALKNRQPTNIDFYEQGIERYLKISQSDDCDIYQIFCASNTNWKPNPETEKIHITELLKILSAAKDNFLQIINEISPSLTNHPWITEWKNA